MEPHLSKQVNAGYRPDDPLSFFLTMIPAMRSGNEGQVDFLSIMPFHGESCFGS